VTRESSPPAVDPINAAGNRTSCACRAEMVGAFSRGLPWPVDAPRSPYPAVRPVHRMARGRRVSPSPSTGDRFDDLVFHLHSRLILAPWARVDLGVEGVGCSTVDNKNPGGGAPHLASRTRSGGYLRGRLGGRLPAPRVLRIMLIRRMRPHPGGRGASSCPFTRLDTGPQSCKNRYGKVFSLETSLR